MARSSKKRAAKISGRLEKLLARLEISHEDALFVLTAAELGYFVDEIHLDPIFDTDLVTRLERGDNREARAAALARNLVASPDQEVREAVDGILAANPTVVARRKKS